MPYTVFISHSSADLEAAKHVASLLRGEGITVLSVGDVVLGDRWLDALAARIRTSDEMAVLVSTHSLRSQAIAAEVGAAHGLHKPLIPILIDVDPDEVPAFLRHRRLVDYADLTAYIGSVRRRAAGLQRRGAGDDTYREISRKHHRGAEIPLEEWLQRIDIPSTVDVEREAEEAVARQGFARILSVLQGRGTKRRAWERVRAVTEGASQQDLSSALKSAYPNVRHTQDVGRALARDLRTVFQAMEAVAHDLQRETSAGLEREFYGQCAAIARRHVKEGFRTTAVLRELDALTTLAASAE